MLYLVFVDLLSGILIGVIFNSVEIQLLEHYKADHSDTASARSDGI